MVVSSSWCLLSLAAVVGVQGQSYEFYQQLASNLETTPEKFVELGGVLDDNCTFSFNASADNCDALIAAYKGLLDSATSNNGTTFVDGDSSSSCGCYSFCRGQNVACYDKGDFPPEFQCNVYDVVAGCQVGVVAKTSPLSPAEEADKPCPEGYMCSQDKERSCEEIRQIPIDLGLGDVHAGLYCPGTDNRTNNNYNNCEAGFYCPDSVTKLPCPAGFFCPHKVSWLIYFMARSAKRILAMGQATDLVLYLPDDDEKKTMMPEIPCDFCPEGAATMRRKPYGYIGFAIVIGLMIILVIWEVFKRYNAGLFEHLVELKSRKVSNLKKTIWSQRRQAKLEKLMPKLEVIENRLKHKSGTYKPEDDGKAEKALNTKRDDGKIVFDARRLFDLMDTEKKGELTYTEINHALELNAVQLREFSKRMNQAAKLPPETETVKRKVFSHYFLRVLEQISHFEPTSHEADELYDEILEHRGEPIDLDGIPHESLFTSPLADFLTDVQINELIKRFRQLQEKQVTMMGSMNDSLLLDNSSGGMGMDESNASQRRRSSNSLMAVPANFMRRLSMGMRRGSMATPRKTRGSDSEVKKSTRSSTTNASGRSRVSVAQTVKRGSVAVKMNDDDIAAVDPENMAEFNRAKWKRPTAFFKFHFSTITRAEFVAWYPSLLTEITEEEQTASIRPTEVVDGVDIAFQDLTLTVSVKKSTITIVDHVTGRLRSGTMTALMGGSGAGKTSLLNALCGRAHYGDVTGTVYINGHKTSIEEHSSAVGFVPQDDIVYAELTVRENLIFSGKFLLPQGTPMQEIEDLADSTMASLGLSRVMHSMVGDVNRRGVSGGEKKRVNIGLELMARPKILFLDEPTSGLDSNSALLVMSSLKTLVTEQGTTICCVIHQPRKFIFELFDSLVLLGVGGKLVYHGPVMLAEQYFTDLNYELPPGEALADWLIDISSGRLEPKDDEETGSTAVTAPTSNGGASEEMDSADLVRAASGLVYPSVEGEESNPLLGDSTAVEFENDAARAKSRREILYAHWKEHFGSLSDESKEIYKAPEAFDLPKKRIMKPFHNQLIYQIHRLFVVGGRNWLAKLIDTSVIVGAVVLIAIMDGTVKATREDSLNDLRYESIAEPTSVEVLVTEFPKLFRYAISANIIDLQGHASKLGVIIAVLVGLSATKVITSKRKEFFREAGSGYNVNAYFAAVNVVATLEHSIQILLCALFALWLRSSLSHWYSYIVSFLMMGWITVSWALLFPIVVPQENVVLVTGFFIVLMSFIFSGANPPVKFETIYNNDALAVFSGIFSPCRFFIESLVVIESMCLPVQSGFTDFGPNFRGDALQAASFRITGQGWNDFGTITVRSFEGWYWGVLPALVVGILIRWGAAGAIHVSDRAKQAKKSLIHDLAKEPVGWIWLILYFIILLGLFGASGYLILRQVSAVEG
ncbi:Putative white-brown complex homolog protein 30 [Seminavis robusta]|uniref:White-brown complex homolog protein 30 n=1 Tax=Seminavis robusta TaxID=568900 RepID=A0A9N8H2T0_9STRA|nr:Putative white-brown complex homolog protein 30 [Seminavis robusta]|eukprot:Sro14_g010500.1 Putative white-brown complex homolog protein 30 (1427) ;mRNA; f:63665-68509